MVSCRLLPLISVGNERFGCCFSAALVKVSHHSLLMFITGMERGSGIFASLCVGAVCTLTLKLLLFVCLLNSLGTCTQGTGKSLTIPIQEHKPELFLFQIHQPHRPCPHVKITIGLI